MALLDGIRVLELSDDPAAAYAGRLLAVYGADVVVVEPPDGGPLRRALSFLRDDPEASPLAAFLHAGKRSVGLDFAKEDDRGRLAGLAAMAEIVLTSGPAGHWEQRGLDLVRLFDARPDLIVVSVSPFGVDGPHAHWRVTSLTSAASGGQLMLCGEPDLPPLKTAGYQAHYQGGLHAFSAALTALFAARQTGLGERIDLSLQEVQAAGLEGFGPAAMVRGSDAERTGNQARAVWGIYPCKDGYIGIASMARQTPSVYRCIGHPELADDPAFLNLLLNPENNDLAAALISDWAADRTAKEIFEASDAFRAPFSIIPTPAELLEWKPLVDAGFWRYVEHPRLGRHPLPAGPFSVDDDRGAGRPAPLLGEHSSSPWPASEAGAARFAPTVSSSRPLLDGIRVLDLSQVWAGPYATRLLADMGADVVHIEGPQFPDAVRIGGVPGHPRTFDTASYFNEYNRNKRGIALDLQHPDGVAAFKRMAAEADVVVDNWSVGVSEGLGIGYPALREINPRLIVLQMPGFARTGPEASRVGFGPTIEQMGGLVSLQGYEGGPPHKSGISYGDPVGGVIAAGAVAAALLRRERTGEGGHVVLYQRDNVVNLIGEFVLAESIGRPLPARQSNRDPDCAPHNVYRTRDDAGRVQLNVQGELTQEYTDTWLAIAVDSDAAWTALARHIGDARLAVPGLATLPGRKARESEIDQILAVWLRDRDPGEVAAALQTAGVSACPVYSPMMLVSDEHLAARGFFLKTVHPEAGEHITTRPAWRLANRPLPAIRPAPCFGQHNREVLAGWGALDDADIDRLAATGVIADRPRGV